MLDDVRDRIPRPTERALTEREPSLQRVLVGGAVAVEMTIHPILHVIARQPQLLAEHAKAYGDLLLEEGRRTLSSLVLHVVLYAAAGILGGLGLVFGGVALLLYAAVPGELRNGWLLLALPLGTMSTGGVCIIVARALPFKFTLDAMGQQVKADIDMIHDTGQP